MHKTNLEILINEVVSHPSIVARAPLESNTTGDWRSKR
jgi:hypothetical protein